MVVVLWEDKVDEPIHEWQVSNKCLTKLLLFKRGKLKERRGMQVKGRQATCVLRELLCVAVKRNLLISQYKENIITPLHLKLTTVYWHPPTLASTGSVIEEEDPRSDTKQHRSKEKVIGQVKKMQVNRKGYRSGQIVTGREKGYRSRQSYRSREKGYMSREKGYSSIEKVTGQKKITGREKVIQVKRKSYRSRKKVTGQGIRLQIEAKLQVKRNGYRSRKNYRSREKCYKLNK